MVELTLGITSGSVTSLTARTPFRKRRLGMSTHGTIRNYKSRREKKTDERKERAEEKRSTWWWVP